MDESLALVAANAAAEATQEVGVSAVNSEREVGALTKEVLAVADVVEAVALKARASVGAVEELMMTSAVGGSATDDASVVAAEAWTAAARRVADSLEKTARVARVAAAELARAQSAARMAVRMAESSGVDLTGRRVVVAQKEVDGKTRL